MKKYGFSFYREEIKDKLELPEVIDNLEKYKDNTQSLDYLRNLSRLRSFYREYRYGNPLDVDDNIMIEICNRYGIKYKQGVKI